MATLPVVVRRRGAGSRLAIALAWLGCAGVVVAAPGVEERSTVPPPAGPDPVVVFQQFQQFQLQVEALTARIEELEHALAQSREQARRNYEALDSRVGAIEEARRKEAEAAAAAAVAEAAARAAAAATAPPADASPAVAPSGVDEQALFDRGLAAVRAKQYDDAIRAFDAQLKQFPRGELAPVAMYWLGEMWLVAATPDPAKAGRYFYRVYNEYPKSPRASLAMYRSAVLQCEAGEVARGRVVLSRLVQQYPASPDAKSAEAALKGACRQ